MINFFYLKSISIRRFGFMDKDQQEKNLPRYYLFQNMDMNVFLHKNSINILMIDDNQRDIDPLKDDLEESDMIAFNFILYINQLEAFQFLDSKK